MERPTCRTAIMLKTGLEWFKPLMPAPNAERHLSITMLNAHTGGGFMEEEDYGSNEPFDPYDSPVDCLQGVIQVLPPPQLAHIKLLVNCRIVPPSWGLKPALLRRRRT